MELPFTHEAFLDVFGRYNVLLWPAVVILWVVTAVIVGGWLRSGCLGGRAVSGLLAAHWGWSAVAYHWLFFRSINPAATVFAALFALQATLFGWLALSARGTATVGMSARGVVSGGLALYALVYPFLGLGFGLEYPRLPLFAVPCPTVLLTAGFLVASTGVPRLLNIVPILWAAIGSSAAFALGIRADLALVIAGAALVLDWLVPSALGTRAAA